MPPRQRAATAKFYGKCQCGCEQSVRTASAYYIPGHAPEFVAIENASGQWILTTGISEEEPQYARIGQVKDLDGTFLEVTVADHPTCGGFVWRGWRKGMMFQVRPTYKR